MRKMFTECDVRRLLEEDAPQGDVTSRVVAEGEARAEITSGEEAVLAGLEEARKVFEHLGSEFTYRAEDGDTCSPGEVVATVEGPAYGILLGERTALNLLMRMSGIATATRKAVERARKSNPVARIAATRKTAPGLRYLDKKAVRIGGGDTHRPGLSGAYLVKENHAVLAGLEEAVKRVLDDASFTRKVEVEVETVEEAVKVSGMGVDAILLDNFSPGEIERCVSKLGDDRPLIESSGGITPENVAEYAAHVDVVSIGWITHSAPARDFSMRLLPD